MAFRTVFAGRRLLAGIALTAVLLAAHTAAAHGGSPQSQTVGVWEEGDEASWMLKTNFGVMTSEHPREFVCEEAFDGGGRFRAAAFDTRTWVIFTADKITRTEDGCSFQKVRDLPGAITDLAIHRSSSKVAFAINSGEIRGIWSSSDAGESFVKVTIDRPNLKLMTIAFDANGKLVVSASVDGPIEGADQGDARFFTAENPDEAVAADAFSRPYLLDVRNGRLLWQGRDSEGWNIVWGSLDAPSGSSRAIDAWARGGVIGPEGNQAQDFWVVGSEKKVRGLLHGTSSEGRVEWDVVAPDHSGICISKFGRHLYLCSRRDREGHDLERRSVGGGSGEGLVDFRELRGPYGRCGDDTDVGRTCPAVWPELADSLGIETAPDSADTGVDGDVGDVSSMDTASATDAERDAAPERDGAGEGGASANASKSAGCATAPGGGPMPVFALLVCVGVAAIRRGPPVS
ncbi:MAG: hypothetical protein ABEN55_22990 [Bradymonadaceae bacterium]